MNTQIIGSYQLELKCNGDRTFLNFWDSAQGNDVCVQVKDGKLFQFVYSEDEIEHEEFDIDNENPMEQKEISLQDFIKQIETSIKAAGDFYSH